MKKNGQFLFESEIFHQLIDETLAAIKDKNGNIIVGQQTTTPTDMSKVVTLDAGQSGVSGVVGQQNNIQTGTSTVNPSQPSTTPPGVKESLMIPNQEWGEQPNVETDIVNWDQLQFIKQDFNSEYNVCVRLFEQQIEYGQLARYLIKKFSSVIGAPHYHTERNIELLKNFILDNKDEMFEAQFCGPHFFVYFSFTTSFDGWSGTISGKLRYAINGNLEDIQLKVKTNKIKKLPKILDNSKIPFEKETDFLNKSLGHTIKKKK